MSEEGFVFFFKRLVKENKVSYYKNFLLCSYTDKKK